VEVFGRLRTADPRLARSATNPRGGTLLFKSSKLPMARSKLSEKYEAKFSRKKRFLKISKKEYDKLGPSAKKKVIETLRESLSTVYSKTSKQAIENQIAMLLKK
jgi:hypothetical protein